MKGFEIIELKQLAGDRCKIYTVRMAGESSSVFERFINEYFGNYQEEVVDIYNRLKFMAQEAGAREQYFKMNEGRPGDLVAALYDTPGRKLRLYCIRYSKIALIVGGGGLKSVRTWQEDPVLRRNVELMMYVADTIYNAMKDKELFLEDDGSLTGKTNFDD